MKHGLAQINTNKTDDLLHNIPEIINKTFPIPERFRRKLPSDVAELSRLLTNKRGSRSLSYLARPNFLSAYLHYFMPWNLFRLCLLLPVLDLGLNSGDTITDIGCGPLTFASALWISRPELRNFQLEFNCIDRCGPALEAGRNFFASLTASNKESSCAWKINTVKEDIDIRQPKPQQKRKQASLVCAVNIFNEIYDNLSHNDTDGLRKMSVNAAKLMHNEAVKNASILTVEPGVPQSGKFISFLRDAFLEMGHTPVSPCTHTAPCPFVNGYTKIIKGRDWIDTKKRWCHFGFETSGAPKQLRDLSKAAKLPKERLVFSYLFTGKANPQYKKDEARIISDAFPLPENRFGRYGCSSQGLVLVTGDRSRINEIQPLSIAKGYFSSENSDGRHDKKSGALIMDL
ncbi:MAG: small ribosomal subunit Rsm22 family protein [Treponema sp.]|nr:small ribosomal subunit Rsm22 family protein [Treponema sp.]